MAPPFEIELEEVAKQDEGADDQQDDIERSECPQEQRCVAVWWRTEVRAEVLCLLQHREHKQDRDDGGEKNDEPFLPFRMPLLMGTTPLVAS